MSCQHVFCFTLRNRSFQMTDFANLQVLRILMRDLKPTKRKAVTFALEWNVKYEAWLCDRCRSHMQKHFHGKLCGTCGALLP